MHPASSLEETLQKANALASQGAFAAAEVEYRRARAQGPRELHAIIGHGHVLRLLGRPGDAREAFAAAIAVMPDLADAHHGLALACQEMSDRVGAETAWRAVLRIRPSDMAAAAGLADLLNSQQRPDEALALLDSIGHPAGAAIEQSRGAARLLKEDYERALAHFDRALAMAPGHPRATHARAVALQHLGREDEAFTAYRKALSDNPANLAAHQGFNEFLYRLKRDGDFLRSYDEAETRMPGVPHFAVAKAQFLLLDGRTEDALAHFDRALAMTPANPAALQGKASALVKLGRADAAIDLYETVLQQQPDNTGLLTSLATAYLIARDPRKAEAAAMQDLKLDPADQVGLAALGTAWRMQGDAREHALNDYDAFVQVIDLEPPPGYADMASFNRDLGALLDTRHNAAREDINQSLRGGTQTLGNIFAGENALLRALKARIDEAVTRYLDHLPRQDHPFLGRRTQDFLFAGAWSSRLQDGGFHTNHLHPGGWISSAYYVALPDPVADTETKQGWLQFAEPSYDVGLAEPVRRAVQPQPGRLVLFPSYFWHGTVPFQAPQSRTTIAFDVVPKRR